MKFDAAAITPGRAKSCQNGTEPSAKSIHTVPCPGIPHVPADERSGATPTAASAATMMRRILFKEPTDTFKRSIAG
jgi:hypothetical protein